MARYATPLADGGERRLIDGPDRQVTTVIEPGRVWVTIERLKSGAWVKTRSRIFQRRCECGNPLGADDTGKCEWCAYAADQPPHEGHRAWFSGTWFCDTCNSPVCDLT